MGCSSEQPGTSTTLSANEAPNGETETASAGSRPSESAVPSDIAVPSPPADIAIPLPSLGEAPGKTSECQRDTYEAKPVELNLLLLLDLSGSMLGKIDADVLQTQWQAVRAAIRTFVESPEADGLGVSLTYFPKVEERQACETDAMCGGDFPCVQQVCLVPTLLDVPVPCLTNRDCTLDIAFDDGTILRDGCIEPYACVNHPLFFCLVDENCPNGDTCNVDGDPVAACPGENSCLAADYEVPAVPLDVLPAGRAALLTSLDESYVDPYSGTPTHVALEGAFGQISQWQASEPNKRSIVILATDGVPEGCETPLEPDPTVPTLGAIESGASNGVNTFVIGVLPAVGNDAESQALLASQTAFLEQMASAGQTASPFLVQADVNTSEAFLEALDQIRTAALPCDYSLPENTKDFGLVNVEASTGGSTSTLPKFDGKQACEDADGWYYDADETPEEDTPSRVVLCPASCEAAKQSALGRVDVVLGCPTIRQAR